MSDQNAPRHLQGRVEIEEQAQRHQRQALRGGGEEQQRNRRHRPRKDRLVDPVEEALARLVDRVASAAESVERLVGTGLEAGADQGDPRGRLEADPGADGIATVGPWSPPMASIEITNDWVK